MENSFARRHGEKSPETWRLVLLWFSKHDFRYDLNLSLDLIFFWQCIDFTRLLCSFLIFIFRFAPLKFPFGFVSVHILPHLTKNARYPSAQRLRDSLALNREQKTWKKKKKREFGSLRHIRFVMAIAKITARETTLNKSSCLSLITFFFHLAALACVSG